MENEDRAWTCIVLLLKPLRPFFAILTLLCLEGGAQALDTSLAPVWSFAWCFSISLPKRPHEMKSHD